jgi:hypothetical protein
MHSAAQLKMMQPALQVCNAGLSTYLCDRQCCHVVPSRGPILCPAVCAEALCQQLAQVAKALVETTITKGAASSSGSSSGVGTGTIPLQQQVALAEAWHLLCELLVAVPTVAGKVSSTICGHHCRRPPHTTTHIANEM